MPDAADPVAILQFLLKFESVTPNSREAVDAASQLLAGRGFDIDQQIFSSPDTPDISNLFATVGSKSPPGQHFAFAGHLDVVPAGDGTAWSSPPFAGLQKDGLIFGRGAADMKGGVAAMIAAATRFLSNQNKGLSGALSFILTGDEEGPAINGTKPLVDHIRSRGERIDFCLLGEPTNTDRLGDTIKVGRRGSLNGTLTVTGTQGHVAYPHLAANPLRPLSQAMTALTKPLDKGNEIFQPSNLEPTSIDTGNPATNVIPGSAAAKFNVRLNSEWNLTSLEEELRKRLAAIDWAGCTWTLNFASDGSEAFYAPPGGFVGELTEVISAHTGLVPELSTSGGTSDARFLKDLCSVVEFGLVGKTMHMVDECVAVADLETLTRIYEGILERFFRQ
ncbi:MAG: succinyl-diaminopimelate desuccinylase [Pseudomonadota bacterium]